MRCLINIALLLLSCTLGSASSYISPDALRLLESGTTYSICQDRFGAIWLNSNYGLLRYNGHMLETIHSPLAMHSLEYDGYDHIFCTTNSSVAMIDIRDNSFRSFHSDDIKFPHCALLAEPDTLWIGSGENIFTLVDGTISPAFSLPQGSDISWIRRAASGRILVSCHSAGLYEIGADGEVSSVYDTGHNISMFHIAGDGSIWVGLLKGGFLHLSRSYVLLDEYLSDGVSENIPFHEVRTFCEPGDGCLYAGSVDGLFVVGPDKSCRKEFYAQEATHSVCSLLSDRSGNMWIGSFYTGVYYKNMTSFPFSSICKDLRLVNDMTKDNCGNVWIVTDNYGMYRFSDGTLHKVESGNNIKFKAILYDAEQDCLWIGDYMSGVVRRYSPGSGKWTSFPILHSDGTISQIGVSSILKKDGELYLGTSSGVFIFNPDMEDSVTRKIPGYDNIVFNMAFGKSGELWVAGHGLLCLGANGFEKKYAFELGNSLSADINIDEDDNIWIARVGHGVDCIGKDGITNYDSSNSGLADNYSTLVCKISPTYVLVGTRSAISVLDLNTCRCNNYSPASGLELSSTRDGCILSMEDGTFWIGGMEGIESIDPKAVDLNEKPFALVFDHMTSGGNIVKPDGLNLPFADAVEISAKDNFFSIDVSDFNYAGVNSIVYEYRLVGFSDKWTEFVPEHPLEFMNLNPGRYRLDVRSSLTKDSNPESEASLDIRIRARIPVFRTFVGYLLSALLLVSLVFIAYNRRKRKAVGNDDQKQKKDIPISISQKYPEFVEGRKLSEEDLDLFSRAAGIVEDHIASDEINVPFLASSLCMSKSTLTLKLRNSLDVSPRDFIENIKLHHAAEMLRTGKYRISEVSDELGFSSPKYFSIRFKRRYGVVPSEFRF